MTKFCITHKNTEGTIEKYSSPTPVGLRLRSISNDNNYLIKDSQGRTVASTDEAIALISKNTELSLVDDCGTLIASTHTMKNESIE